MIALLAAYFIAYLIAAWAIFSASSPAASSAATTTTFPQNWGRFAPQVRLFVAEEAVGDAAVKADDYATKRLQNPVLARNRKRV